MAYYRQYLMSSLMNIHHHYIFSSLDQD